MDAKNKHFKRDLPFRSRRDVTSLGQNVFALLFAQTEGLLSTAFSLTLRVFALILELRMTIRHVDSKTSGILIDREN